MTAIERLHAITSARKVAITHDWLTIMGGAEEVLRVTHEAMPTVPIFVAQFNQEKLTWLQGKDVRSHWITNMPLSKTKHYLYSPFLADCYRSFDLSEFDLVVTFSHTFAHHAIPAPGAAHFCCYHSPARSLWFPDIDNRAGTGFARQMIINRLKRLDLEASKNPTFLVGNSWTIARRVQEIYNRPVDNVLYPSVDVEKWLDTPRVSDDEGYTMWSRLIPYKKFDLAIQASKMGSFKLNIVGSGPYEDKLKDMASDMPNVVFHGRLSDPDLKSLLSRSRGVLFPGYEDFGIVPVEAMAAGLPVVVYDQGGAAETVTSEFGEHISEQTPEQICAAVQRLEKKSFDPNALKERSKAFGIDRFYTELADYLEQAIDRGPNRRW